MSRLDDLKAAIFAIDAEGTEAEITQAAELLEAMRSKISVRALPEEMQNIRVMNASANGDRETLRHFAAYSQFPEVRAWAAQALAPRKTAMRLTL